MALTCEDGYLGQVGAVYYRTSPIRVYREFCKWTFPTCPEMCRLGRWLWLTGARVSRPNFR